MRLTRQHCLNGDRGLRRHQLKCEEFLQADNEASTLDDALEKYRHKLQSKLSQTMTTYLQMERGWMVRLIPTFFLKLIF